jgi:RND superfamily putative drug exporter
VTSAAIVMVAVFSLFAMLRLPEMKQLGVGLAAAVLIDATIVRAVALPAVVTLLGERNWRVRAVRERARRPRPSALIERSGDATLRPIHDR